MFFQLQVDAPGGRATIQFKRGSVEQFTLPSTNVFATYTVHQDLIEIKDTRHLTFSGLIEGDSDVLHVLIQTVSATVGFYPGSLERAIVTPGQTREFVWSWRILQDQTPLANKSEVTQSGLVGWSEAEPAQPG